ncbi:MAG: aldehyde dehydrogenase family protein [Candidatus Melainabacteria bacterium]|nr:aldehyde dehydrogenase family protein [Candidatus Melainabacteria bacterium]
MVTSKTATLKSINPANLEVLGEVPVMLENEVRQTVEKARLAQEDWQLLDFGKRASLVLRLRRLISRQSKEIAELISNEVGKPIGEAFSAEINGTLDTCVWLADNAERLLKDQMIAMTNPMLSSKQSVIAFEPLGVIGIISPWNYPFSIPMMAALMSVMVGNTVVLKPSEKSSLIGIKIGDLFREAGFPEGVMSVVTGDKDTGRYLSESGLARVIFTGSVEGGRKVMEQAAATITPVSLELGGKDAAIVLPSAPVKWTAQGIAWGAFTNAGQACASIERLFILKSKKTDQFLDELVAVTRGLKVGPASDPTVDIGPVIDQTQLDKIAAQVDQAREAGATILTGGSRIEDMGGHFFQPTIITDVNPSMAVMQEETFGPVLPVMVVESEDDVVDLVNNSQYGLTASIWGKNLKRAENIARDLDVGTVFINDCLFSHAAPQLPWGGVKKSGFGRTHSHFGLLDLVNIKHISIDAAGGATRLWWYPYGPARTKTIEGGIQLFHGSFPFGKLSGMCKFVGNILRNPKKLN